jgi:hypothetical protein
MDRCTLVEHRRLATSTQPSGPASPR